MKYLKAIVLFVIGFVLMKVTNSTIHDLLLANKPPGISLWRALVPVGISMIPLIFFTYRAYLCIGYKKEDFRLGKKDNHTLSKEDYAEALYEFENKRDEQLWTKYFAESDGDESKAKAKYLKDRAEILSKEDKNQVNKKPSLNKLSDEEREKMYQSVKDYKDGKL